MGASSPKEKVIDNKLRIINSADFVITNNLSPIIDVNYICNNFYESPHEIQSFYDEETVGDQTFNALKKGEKKILNNEIDNLRDSFIKEFQNILRLKTSKKRQIKN